MNSVNSNLTTSSNFTTNCHYRNNEIDSEGLSLEELHILLNERGIKISQLENQIRTLTGQIENLTAARNIQERQIRRLFNKAELMQEKTINIIQRSKKSVQQILQVIEEGINSSNFDCATIIQLLQNMIKKLDEQAGLEA